MRNHVAGFIGFLMAIGSFGLTSGQSFDETEIHGYHFHTYFFQTKDFSVAEAVLFREAIQEQIDAGFLKECRLNHLNMGPVGPHPIGSYETCCNKTSISQAMSWFMQNHGNLTILLHPLTRWEVEDHTSRVMFFGDSHKIDISVLAEDLGDDTDLCLPLKDDDEDDNESTTPDSGISLQPVQLAFSIVFAALIKLFVM